MQGSTSVARISTNLFPPYNKPGTFPVYILTEEPTLRDTGNLEPFPSTGLRNLEPEKPFFHHTGDLEPFPSTDWGTFSPPYRRPGTFLGCFSHATLRRRS